MTLVLAFESQSRKPAAILALLRAGFRLFGGIVDSPLSFTEGQFLDRVSSFATDATLARHMPKKHKKKSTGVCPCCGEPCAPFTTCKKYREMQSIGHVARQLVEEGIIKVVGKKGNELIYRKVPEKYPVNQASRTKAKQQRKSRRSNR